MTRPPSGGYRGASDAADVPPPSPTTVETRTEWGVRGAGSLLVTYDGLAHSVQEHLARLAVSALGGHVVRRTVTYGPWTEVTE